MRYQELLTEAEKKLKHGSSKGHMGEFIIGSAVVAKMIAGAESINADNIKSVMLQTSATDDLSQTFKSNEGDEIEFVNIIKNEKNIADAKDVDALSEVMASEILGAVKFANSDIYAKKWAKIFAKNGKPDKILVKAAGEEDQSGTKADIFLIYRRPNGEERVIKGWSLKTGSSMIGQGSPRTFANMEVFFNELGVTLKPIENYDENPKEHIVHVMEQVRNEINSYTIGDDDVKEAQLIDNISNFMSEHINKKDPRVYIVNLGKADYSAQTVSKMKKNLSSVDLESSLKLTGRPELIVHNKGNIRDILFKIRYTYSAPRIDSKGKQKPERHKLVVETGKLFKTLGTISVKDVEEEN